MGFTLSTSVVPRGKVIFRVKNNGALPHDLSFGKGRKTPLQPVRGLDALWGDGTGGPRSNLAYWRAVSSLSNFGFSANNVSSADAHVNAEVGALAGVAATSEARARRRGVFGLTVNVANQFRTVTPPAAEAAYPGTSSLSSRTSPPEGTARWPCGWHPAR